MTGILQGLTISCSGFDLDEREEIYSHVKELGGNVKENLTTVVTHLIARTSVGSEKYKAAVYAGIPIVIPNFIVDCVNKSKELVEALSQRKKYHRKSCIQSDEEDSTDELFLDADEQAKIIEKITRKNRILPFTGLRICVTGLYPEDRSRIEALLFGQRDDNGNIVGGGGSYSPDLYKTCTHLIANKPSGNKYNYAKMWGIYIVSPHWFEDSVAAGTCQDEERYPAGEPPISFDKIAPKYIGSQGQVPETVGPASHNHQSPLTPDSPNSKCETANDNVDPGDEQKNIKQESTDSKSRFLNSCVFALSEEALSTTRRKEWCKKITFVGGSWISEDAFREKIARGTAEIINFESDETGNYRCNRSVLLEWGSGSLPITHYLIDDSDELCPADLKILEEYNNILCWAQAQTQMQEPLPRPYIIQCGWLRSSIKKGKMLDLDEFLITWPFPERLSKYEKVVALPKPQYPPSKYIQKRSLTNNENLRENTETKHNQGSRRDNYHPHFEQKDDGPHSSVEAFKNNMLALGVPNKKHTGVLLRASSTGSPMPISNKTGFYKNIQDYNNHIGRPKPMGKEIDNTVSHKTHHHPAATESHVTAQNESSRHEKIKPNDKDEPQTPLQNNTKADDNEGEDYDLRAKKGDIFKSLLFCCVGFSRKASEMVKDLVTGQQAIFHSLIRPPRSLKQDEVARYEWWTNALKQVKIQAQGQAHLMYIVAPLQGFADISIIQKVSKNIQSCNLVTECWLERCLEDDVCYTSTFSPDDVFVENVREMTDSLFRPISYSLPIPGSGKIIASISGFEGIEREHICKLCTILGFEFSERFFRRMTHLICSKPFRGEKYKRALKWGVEVVDLNWLYSIATTGIIPQSDSEKTETATRTSPRDEGEAQDNLKGNQTGADASFLATSIMQESMVKSKAVVVQSGSKVDNTMLFEESMNEDKISEPQQNQPASTPAKKLLISTNGSFLTPKHIDKAGQTPSMITPRYSSMRDTGSLYCTPGATPLNQALDRNLQAAITNLHTKGIGPDNPENSSGTEPTDKQNFPQTDANRIPFQDQTSFKNSRNLPLSGVVCCLSQRLFHRKQELIGLATELGARLVSRLEVGKTSYYIHQSTREREAGKDFNTAKRNNIPVVSPWWLYACRDEGGIVDPLFYSHTYQPNKALALFSPKKNNVLRPTYRQSPRKEQHQLHQPQVLQQIEQPVFTKNPHQNALRSSTFNDNREGATKSGYATENHNTVAHPPVIEKAPQKAVPEPAVATNSSTAGVNDYPAQKAGIKRPSGDAFDSLLDKHQSLMNKRRFRLSNADSSKHRQPSFSSNSIVQQGRKESSNIQTTVKMPQMSPLGNNNMESQIEFHPESYDTEQSLPIYGSQQVYEDESFIEKENLLSRRYAQDPTGKRLDFGNHKAIRGEQPALKKDPSQIVMYSDDPDSIEERKRLLNQLLNTSKATDQDLQHHHPRN
ncbi:protein kinase activating protein dpb11 [Mycoemilia scoparia]|uniref:Protein kinase activating protein dpb11 n=1 Tax=Mycoemilia scoparia TaxID=417184 RepID=A0A9W7ZSZ2_9FUNG|nr:protein kinase activating protein dpb11 [Mycoemilia scoparia]